MFIFVNQEKEIKAATYDYVEINGYQITASMSRATGKLYAKTTEGTGTIYLTAKINRASFSNATTTGAQVSGYVTATSIASGNGLPTSGYTNHTATGYGQTKSMILSGSF